MTNLKAQKTKAKGAATPIAYKNTQSDSTNNTSHNQRMRLLDYLKTHGTITTLQARSELDILAPAARIFELRHYYGYRINKVDIVDYTEAKRKHTGIAKYVLVSEKVSEVAV